MRAIRTLLILAVCLAAINIGAVAASTDTTVAPSPETTATTVCLPPVAVEETRSADETSTETTVTLEPSHPCESECPNCEEFWRIIQEQADEIIRLEEENCALQAEIDAVEVQ